MICFVTGKYGKITSSWFCLHFNNTEKYWRVQYISVSSSSNNCKTVTLQNYSISVILKGTVSSVSINNSPHIWVYIDRLSKRSAQGFLQSLKFGFILHLAFPNGN